MAEELMPSVPALVAALRRDPFYLAITEDFSRDQERREEALRLYFDYSMREGARSGRRVLADPPALGAAIWSLPVAREVRDAEAAAKTAYLRDMLGPEGNENYHRILGFMTARAEAAVPEAAWYLSILGVAPEAQGKGIGARLLAPTLAEADAEGVVCWLESFSARNLRFYERAGFERAASHAEPVTASEYVILRRAPRGF